MKQKGFVSILIFRILALDIKLHDYIALADPGGGAAPAPPPPNGRGPMIFVCPKG